MRQLAGRRRGGFIQLKLLERRSPMLERSAERRARLLELLLAGGPPRRRLFQARGRLALDDARALGSARGLSQLAHQLAVAVEHVAPVGGQLAQQRAPGVRGEGPGAQLVGEPRRPSFEPSLGGDGEQ